MKKIVPFEKEISFKTQLSEVTSISLEHTLQIQNQIVMGEFIISGDYRLTDTSNNTEPFRFDLPLTIEISEDYLTGHASVDIDDFYYEIMNNNALVIHIDVKIDHLEEKPLYVKEIKEESEPMENLEEMRDSEMVEEVKEVKEIEKVEEITDMIEEKKTVEPFRDTLDTTKEVKSLFANFDEGTETFVTYKICIVRENDTIETIQEKYSISREELEKYNNLTEIKIGDKLIIPALIHAQD